MIKKKRMKVLKKHLTILLTLSKTGDENPIFHNNDLSFKINKVMFKTQMDARYGTPWPDYDSRNCYNNFILLNKPTR